MALAPDCSSGDRLLEGKVMVDLHRVLRVIVTFWGLFTDGPS